jgi:hypothetical protein
MPLLLHYLNYISGHCIPVRAIKIKRTTFPQRHKQPTRWQLNIFHISVSPCGRVVSDTLIYTSSDVRCALMKCLAENRHRCPRKRTGVHQMVSECVTYRCKFMVSQLSLWSLIWERRSSGSSRIWVETTFHRWIYIVSGLFFHHPLQESTSSQTSVLTDDVLQSLWNTVVLYECSKPESSAYSLIV